MIHGAQNVKVHMRTKLRAAMSHKTSISNHYSGNVKPYYSKTAVLFNQNFIEQFLFQSRLVIIADNCSLGHFCAT